MPNLKTIFLKTKSIHLISETAVNELAGMSITSHKILAKEDVFHFPNPLHPNISMHILHTILYTFPKVLTRRICLPIKRLVPGDHFLYSLFDSRVILQGKIRFKSLVVFKELIVF